MNEQMSRQIMTMLTCVASIKNYRVHKHDLNHTERLFSDNGENSTAWERIVETNGADRQYVNKDLLVSLRGRREVCFRLLIRYFKEQ